MKNDDSTDSDLQKRFQHLREQESNTGPAFQESLPAAERINTKPKPPIWIPIAAAVLIGLIPVALFRNSEAERPDVALNLPTLFIGEPDNEALITDIPISFSRSVPTDSLFPLQLQIKL